MQGLRIVPNAMSSPKFASLRRPPSAVRRAREELEGLIGHRDVAELRIDILRKAENAFSRGDVENIRGVEAAVFVDEHLERKAHAHDAEPA